MRFHPGQAGSQAVATVAPPSAPNRNSGCRSDHLDRYGSERGTQMQVASWAIARPIANPSDLLASANAAPARWQFWNSPAKMRVVVIGSTIGTQVETPAEDAFTIRQSECVPADWVMSGPLVEYPTLNRENRSIRSRTKVERPECFKTEGGVTPLTDLETVTRWNRVDERTWPTILGPRTRARDAWRLNRRRHSSSFRTICKRLVQFSGRIDQDRRRVRPVNVGAFSDAIASGADRILCEKTPRGSVVLPCPQVVEPGRVEILTHELHEVDWLGAGRLRLRANRAEGLIRPRPLRRAG